MRWRWASAPSIYLLHGILWSVLFTEGHAVTDRLSLNELPILLPFAAIVIVAVAAVSYSCIERPGILLGGRLGRTITHRPARPLSQADDVAP